jgi:hypothetical protein
LGTEIMSPEQAKIRLDDDDLEVALAPAEFDQKVKELISGDTLRDLPSRIERVVYWRGDFPRSPLWVARLWWALGIGAGLVFLYGLYALVQKVLSYVSA